MSERWEPAIRAFEEQDRAAPPAPGGLLFTGSSTIVHWATLAQDFPFAPVLNRGFGGSQVADVVEYVDRVIVAYRPRVVVVYSGDNDLAAGKSVEEVLADFVALEERAHAALPGLPLVIIGLKPSPKRWHLADAMRALDCGLEEWAAGAVGVDVIPIREVMLGADGAPRPELYSDGLHLTPEGYRLWVAHLAPHLRRIWTASAAASGGEVT